MSAVPSYSHQTNKKVRQNLKSLFNALPTELQSQLSLALDGFEPPTFLLQVDVNLSSIRLIAMFGIKPKIFPYERNVINLFTTWPYEKHDKS